VDGLVGDAELLGDLPLGRAGDETVGDLPAGLGAGAAQRADQVQDRGRGVGRLADLAADDDGVRGGLAPGVLDGVSGEAEDHSRRGGGGLRQVVDAAGADADRPVHPREPERGVHGERGRRQDGLDLVAHGALEGSDDHRLPAGVPRPERRKDLLDAVPVVGGPVLVCGDDVHTSRLGA
jgi:hypothetical protein